MRLRYQLFLISLLLLVFPWSTWQYLKAFDQALRQSHAQALNDYVKLISNRLAASPDFFAAPFTAKESAALDSQVMYAYSLPSAAVIDGYEDEWRAYNFASMPLSDKVSLYAGVFEQRVYFFIDVKDDELVYYNPATKENNSWDRLSLTLNHGEKPIQYLVQTSSPGSINAYKISARSGALPESKIRGVWQESTQGYQLELVMDAPLLLNGFSLSIIDHDAADTKPEVFTQNYSLIAQSNALKEFIAQLAGQDMNIHILNQDRWLIASIKNKAGKKSSAPWLLEWFYRKLLDSDHLPQRKSGVGQARLNYAELDQSKKNHSALGWYRFTEKNDLSHKTLASVALPVFLADKKLGYVLLEKSTDQLVALTSSAFLRLFLYSIAGFLVVFVFLFLYSSWLSMRIFRLNRAGFAALNNRDELVIDTNDWPELNSKDEIGQLSRAYHRLLIKISEYNYYLKDLANKLAHELRTPIAVVRSSLDNLAQVSTAQSREKYLSRAQQGLDRLSTILTAMSSANRTEQSIQTIRPDDFEAIEIKPFLKELAAMYQDMYRSDTIQFKCDESNPKVLIANELFVQMLDKFIDNARDFSVASQPIFISLKTQENRVVLSVENSGPLLPESMSDRLFESMISQREQTTASGQVHLGLGLYVARLIADVHGAEVKAENNPSRRGVIFSVIFK